MRSSKTDWSLVALPILGILLGILIVADLCLSLSHLPDMPADPMAADVAP